MAGRWIRDATPVTVKVAEPLSDKTMIIQNESYSEAHRHEKVESLIVHSNQEYYISGKLCVKKDGSVYVKNPGDLPDVACKHKGRQGVALQHILELQSKYKSTVNLKYSPKSTVKPLAISFDKLVKDQDNATIKIWVKILTAATAQSTECVRVPPPYEFIRWELVITDQPRDQPQPRCILLESQLESLKHHFVHWNLSDPVPAVTCQQLPKYDFNGPQIETSDSRDQEFVWVIPPEESNHFSLQSFGRSYYLAFRSDSKATLHEGSASDQQHNSIFRLESHQ